MLAPDRVDRLGPEHTILRHGQPAEAMIHPTQRQTVAPSHKSIPTAAGVHRARNTKDAGVASGRPACQPRQQAWRGFPVMSGRSSSVDAQLALLRGLGVGVQLDSGSEGSRLGLTCGVGYWCVSRSTQTNAQPTYRLSTIIHCRTRSDRPAEPEGGMAVTTESRPGRDRWRPRWSRPGSCRTSACAARRASTCHRLLADDAARSRAPGGATRRQLLKTAG
jgi:hypothetical protein